jgi:protein TonB
MIRYNIPTPSTARFGVASALLHITALAALVVMVTRPIAPVPSEDVTAEVMFEQPEEPRPSPVPAAETPPQQPPVAEAPPEPVSPPVVETQVAPKPPPRPVVKAPAEKPAAVASQPVQTAAPVAPTAIAAAAVDPSWQLAVSNWLASRKSYPEEARRRGEEGRVAIRFTVDRSGRVVEAAIVGASGSERLDEAALGLLRQAELPAFPVAMTQARVTITTTMRYSLR